MFERVRVANFLLAGSAGFCADALVLSALVNRFGWSPFTARAVSFSIAMAITWYLNRRMTFKDRPSRGMGPELARYALVQIGGVVVNYGVFSALVTLWGQAARWPVIALVPASAIAMCFTYVGMHFFAFPATARGGT
jgi:putative flippase GtrA